MYGKSPPFLKDAGLSPRHNTECFHWELSSALSLLCKITNLLISMSRSSHPSLSCYSTKFMFIKDTNYEVNHYKFPYIAMPLPVCDI
jgi:hypothetical protein